MLTIYQAYDKSIELMRAGEEREAAIYHALQYEISYEYDAQEMLTQWHHQRVAPFHINGGYPRLAPERCPICSGLNCKNPHDGRY